MDPFDTFGIPPAFEVDLAALEQRFRDLSRVVHPDKFAAGGAGERRRALSLAVDVNAAWRILRDPVRRAEALLARSGGPIGEESQPKASAELLMDVMERREELAEAKGRADVAKVRELAARVRERERGVVTRLGEGFAAIASAPARRTDVIALVGELKYLRRFLDEVSAIEEELA